MNLHRTKTKPQWHDTSHADRTTWQHIAAATYGVVTPGNLLTSLGFVLSVLGLAALIQEQYWLGLAGLILGRLCDVADGWAAERTRTKSPIGEVMDAAVDKLITFGSLVVLGITQLVPWWVLACLLFAHLLIIVISAIRISRGHHLHPSLRGKLSMACAWLSLILLVLSAATQGSAVSELAAGFGYTLAIVATALGLAAAYGYMKER